MNLETMPHATLEYESKNKADAGKQANKLIAEPQVATFSSLDYRAAFIEKGKAAAAPRDANAFQGAAVASY